MTPAAPGCRAGTCSGSGAWGCAADGCGRRSPPSGSVSVSRAIVGVLGISQSSKTGLLNELGQLGNLHHCPGQQHRLRPADRAAHHVRRHGVAYRTGHRRDRDRKHLEHLRVPHRSFVPSIDTNGISLTATDAALPATLGATMAHGAFLNAATAHFPAVVLGAEAASLLGIENLANPTQVWIGGHWFTVVGILNPVELVSQMDSMAFIGFPIAEQYFGFDGHPTELFLRTVPSQVTAVADVLPATVNPADPSTVACNLPSDILKAEVAAKGAYNGLFLGLGAVALLVGGVGIANVMVISVLERRSEIGLRRALGASRRHVAEQFLAEALLLAVLGGVAGTVIGAGGHRHLRAEPALVGADPLGGPLWRCWRRSGYRRHRRPVPVDAGGPPLADRGVAHGMSCPGGRLPSLHGVVNAVGFDCSAVACCASALREDRLRLSSFFDR